MLTSIQPHATALCVISISGKKTAISGHADGKIYLYNLNPEQTKTPNQGYLLTSAPFPVTLISAIATSDHDVLVFFGSDNGELGVCKVNFAAANKIQLGQLTPPKQEFSCAYKSVGISIIKVTTDCTSIVVIYANAEFAVIEVAQDLTGKVTSTGRLPVPYESIVNVAILPYYDTTYMRQKYYFFVLTASKKLFYYSYNEALKDVTATNCLAFNVAKMATSDSNCDYILYIRHGHEVSCLTIPSLQSKLITANSSSHVSPSIADSAIVVASQGAVYMVRNGELHEQLLPELMSAGLGPSPLSSPSGSTSSSVD